MKKTTLFALMATVAAGIPTISHAGTGTPSLAESQSPATPTIEEQNSQHRVNSQDLIEQLTTEFADYGLTIDNDPIHPWYTEDGCLRSSNGGDCGSTSALTFEFNTKDYSEITFDWHRSGYYNTALEVFVDGVNRGRFDSYDWETKHFCVEKGHHTITFRNVIQEDYSDAEYDVTRIRNLKIQTYDMLQIDVTAPGTLGDLILDHVENFVDVKRLKISGSLNEADLVNLKQRLTEVRELDLKATTITTIPRDFFRDRSTLYSVMLPAALITIEDGAFYCCRNLEKVDFPSTLQRINRDSFYECNALKSVKLPLALQTLGDFAFYDCQALETVEFSEGLITIGNNTFDNCHKLSNLHFPNTLHTIGSYAFSNNRSLSNVVFNEGLFQIADNAFYDCDALTEVTLPSSLVYAYESPFDYCDNLTKVTCLSIIPPIMTDQIPYGLEMTGRTLYVPALSINVYKQTTGWDRFPTIKPIDCLPETINVISDLHLTLPENIPTDYKPKINVTSGTRGYDNTEYGSLTVNGDNTLSMNSFSLYWDVFSARTHTDWPTCYATLLNNSHLRADQVSVDINIYNNEWTFFSLPFNAKVSDLEFLTNGDTQWVIRRYDAQKRAAGEMAETWVRLTTNDMLNAGEGYIIQTTRNTESYRDGYNTTFRMKAVNDSKKNQTFTSDDATVVLKGYESELAHNRSWNFVGNPYPCYFDTRFLAFDAPLTIWDANYSTYTAYSPVDDAYVLRPGEAFFVQRPVTGGNLVFDKAGRQINSKPRELSSQRRVTMHEHRLIVNLTLSDGTTADRTRIVLNEAALTDYEMDKDAHKFMSSDTTVPQLFTVTNGVNYAINERPLSDGTMNLSARIGHNGTYTIALDEHYSGEPLLLEDKQEGQTVTLSAGDSYQFAAKAGTLADRFMIHFTDASLNSIETLTTDAATNRIHNVEGKQLTVPSQQGVLIQNGKKVLYNK